MDHNDIYTIVKRLAVLEGRITPDNVKKGLNSQQKAVPQMPALFKMPAQGPVLGGNANKKAPSSGYMVGGCAESTEIDEALDEAVTSEDKLDKVKKSFADYLNSIDSEKKDTDLKDRVKSDTDIKDKVKKDSSIIAKQITAVAEEPNVPPPAVHVVPETISAPVKTIALEDGRACEIHGDEHRGFEIRHGGRAMKSRFKNIDQAQMALEMYIARHKQQDESADYIEEA